MVGLFDDLSDADSFEVYYDSEFEIFEAARDFDDSSSDSGADLDKEDLFGPDLQDPGDSDNEEELIPTIYWGPKKTPSLPIRQPQPVRPLVASTLTVQAFESLVQPSQASTAPQGRKQNSLGARISALALLDAGVSDATILLKTGVS